MSDRILMNPENRWLASSGSNDFSLYGAQPDPAVTLRADQGGASDADTNPDAWPGSARPVREPSDGDAGDGFGTENSPASFAAPGSTVAAAARPAGAPASADAASAPPAAAEAPPTGSLAPLEAVPGALSLKPFLDPPVTASEAAPAAAQEVSLSGLADGLSLAAPVIAPEDADLAEAGSQPAMSDALVPVSGPIVAIADAPAALLSGAEASAPDLPGAVSETIEPGALGEASELLGQSAGGVFATLGEAGPADADDGVEDLLGSDPAGGIATLVSLVSVSDVLPVAQTTNEAGGQAEAPASEMLDALAADPPETNNLLGEAGDDGAAPAAGGLLPLPDPPGGSDLPGGLG